jgi:hypothetical protein
VIAVAVLDVLGLLGILGVCGGMLVLANRIEPHWVARDQRRFLAVAHDIDQFGLRAGRKREVRVHVDPEEDALMIRGRSMLRPSSGIWVVRSKVPSPPRGRVVYILKKVSGTTDGDTMALRLPEKSKMIPRMEQLLAVTGDDARATHAPTGQPTYEDDDPS